MGPLGAYSRPMPKQRFNLSIEPRQLAALKRIEQKTGARASEQIRRAIDLWLSAHERPDRPQNKNARRGAS
jgi:hypothetical protein